MREYNIALSPLFLVRGGAVYPNYPSEPFRNAGVNGIYWSSRASSNADNAYYLNFLTNNVYPSYDGDRYAGRSLRCLIPTP